MSRILVVDDEPRIVEALCRLLKIESFESEGAYDGEGALKLLDRGGFDAVLLDLDMPRLDGIATLRALRDRGDRIPVIIVSGRGTIARAVEAVRLGAHDFVEKPVDDERLLLSLRRALEFERLTSEIAMRRDDQGKAEIIAKSPAMRRILDSIPRIGASEASVLISGETGTGKEIVAHLLHRASTRRERALVKVNCAALPDALAESELFGHVRGAFTGALKDRKGRFALADGGTLFLDEIGELSSALQAKLLRALGEGEFEPVGSDRTMRADVRVITATNRDLEAAIKAGTFRSDLYFRTAIIVIAIPPLRERREDIAPLARHFLSLAKRRVGRPDLDWTPDAIAALEAGLWPGNVRELRNIVERLAVIAPDAMIDAEGVRGSLPVADPALGPARIATGRPGTLAEALEAEEARVLRKALEEAGDNVAAAARALGLERSHFHKKLKRHGIR
jgi:two-component system nitrogen regulation response regulator NtrX